jgi:hypothetical protein
MSKVKQKETTVVWIIYQAPWWVVPVSLTVAFLAPKLTRWLIGLHRVLRRQSLLTMENRTVYHAEGVASLHTERSRQDRTT